MPGDEGWKRYLDPGRVARGVLWRLVTRRRRWLAHRRYWLTPMEVHPVRLADLGLGHEHRVNHLASWGRTLRRILPPDEIGPDDVFLDLGSGMGRMVVIAARRYAFGRVVGVEISRELHEIAERNVARNRRRLRCGDIELVNADVLDFRIPDDVTVVYLYNPFRGPILRHVIDELERSVDRNPRQIRIVYVCPREEAQFLASRRISIVRSARAIRGDRTPNTLIRLYALTPESA